MIYLSSESTVDSSWAVYVPGGLICARACCAVLRAPLPVPCNIFEYVTKAYLLSLWTCCRVSRLLWECLENHRANATSAGSCVKSGLFGQLTWHPGEGAPNQPFSPSRLC